MMKIYVVGLGPGNFSDYTSCQEALKAADVVVAIRLILI